MSRCKHRTPTPQVNIFYKAWAKYFTNSQQIMKCKNFLANFFTCWSSSFSAWVTPSNLQPSALSGFFKTSASKASTASLKRPLRKSSCPSLRGSGWPTYGFISENTYTDLALSDPWAKFCCFSLMKLSNTTKYQHDIRRRKKKANLSATSWLRFCNLLICPCINRIITENSFLYLITEFFSPILKMQFRELIHPLLISRTFVNLFTGKFFGPCISTRMLKTGNSKSTQNQKVSA